MKRPIVTNTGNWRDAAACTGDPDLFFPEGAGRGNHRQVEEAKAVCRACPVQPACADAAFANGEQYGVWGGLSEGERRRIRRREVLTR
ncbi:WhiB family transcriptional regulator [Streptomyces sp. NPDC096153]|uniref:WhiB family transcriptional regulator n=1 Tax=Streptomyces sp. NPDC096153 TaxID=3155548 RepID=UPI003328DC4F